MDGWELKKQSFALWDPSLISLLSRIILLRKFYQSISSLFYLNFVFKETSFLKIFHSSRIFTWDHLWEDLMISESETADQVHFNLEIKDFHQSTHTWYMQQPINQSIFRNRLPPEVQEVYTISLLHSLSNLNLFNVEFGERIQNHIFWVFDLDSQVDFQVWCPYEQYAVHADRLILLKVEKLKFLYWKVVIRWVISKVLIEGYFLHTKKQDRLCLFYEKPLLVQQY